MQNGETSHPKNQSKNKRLRLEIQGAVQGVGFRPFVYRLANQMRLNGWAVNTSQGVTIEVEGAVSELDTFVQRLNDEKPPHSIILDIQQRCIEPCGESNFTIRHSNESGGKSALMLPDLATCSECTEEIFDPSNRRYLYPFTNCTNCGPRFSIILDLPYDRANTSMQSFVMCSACQTEYDDPSNRRFHAQPNACPDCGPRLECWDHEGRVCAENHDALLQTAEAIREGRIVAVKGLGGFHLVVDARNQEAVQRLRQRKHRDEKPLAVMFPNVETIRQVCQVTLDEEAALVSAQAPIVLVETCSDQSLISESVAPCNPYLGVMLPYTPLHLLLLEELAFPVVATSGNLSDEPICIDEHEALNRLREIADLFLVHNRPIVRHVDDSVVRVDGDGVQVMRRARGYAPFPITLKEEMVPTLAVGAHLKNTTALSFGKNVFISQHIGDLETAESYKAFSEVIDNFQQVYEIKPERVACDLHPDYLSTKYAEQLTLPIERVQHHHAHIVACMAEHGLNEPVLGVAWDGTGFGPDGTIWGGEFLLSTLADYQRIATFRTFPLPSGEGAVKRPHRSALGLLFDCFGDDLNHHAELVLKTIPASEKNMLLSMLHKEINSPQTSSVGRLFDAVAFLAGIQREISFEGQAAMQLEFSMGSNESTETYPYTIRESDSMLTVDWEPMIRSVLADRTECLPIAQIALRFHNTLVTIIGDIAQQSGLNRVVLSGGCFQNRYLSTHAVSQLRKMGFDVYQPRLVPPNDGGIALGQIVIANYRRKKHVSGNSR